MSEAVATTPTMGAAPRSRARTAALAVLLSLPLVGLVVLLAAPELDVRWEHHPSHFWLVLLVALVNVGLGLATGEAARRRSDARLVLVSLALLSSAGFLALHALATPGVLLESANTGFVVATPIGLLAGGSVRRGLGIRERAEAEPLGQLELKGKSQHVEAFSLISV